MVGPWLVGLCLVRRGCVVLWLTRERLTRFWLGSGFVVVGRGLLPEWSALGMGRWWWMKWALWGAMLGC